MRRLPIYGVWSVAGAMLLALTPLWAGLRGPGKYSGVVFFDRWGTCMLLSGPYLTYISESVKESLRPYTGKAVQINAVTVSQPTNPGDALIREYTVLGPAPAPRFLKLDGLVLRLSPVFQPEGKAGFVLSIQNDGQKPITVLTQEIGITLLGTLGTHKEFFSPSDGSSDAMITRASLFSVSGRFERTSEGRSYYASYSVVGEAVMPDHLELAPGHVKTYTIVLDASPGQYQFVCGYGGGVHEEASIISNAVSFDISPSGVASTEK